MIDSKFELAYSNTTLVKVKYDRNSSFSYSDRWFKYNTC